MKDRKQPPRKPPPPRKDDRKRSEQEVLREQARTEVEEHPYLDTEGGE